ncbi:MAG: hypothetical protein JJ975_11220 [Bacteroidia bacterium]|nr:hypothetical protein [Bacteroidia bacterium]
MSSLKRVSANKAYRKGLRWVLIWPITINVLLAAGLVFSFLEGFIPLVVGVWLVVAFVTASVVWSFRQKARWQLWMVNTSSNPKTSIELARASFLKSGFSRATTLWLSKEKDTYNRRFEERMDALRKDYLASASEKYGDRHTVNVTYAFSGLLWVLLFELVVLGGLGYLFWILEDPTLKTMISVLLVLAVIGTIYTMRTIWKRNTTVLEIAKHGIRIEETYFGWLELEEIDIVRGNLLVYKKFNEEQQEYKLKNLSISGEYLDELILFYRTQDQGLKEV